MTTTRTRLDARYARMVEGLPAALRKTATSLPARLGLAPEGTPWSEVFGHAVTLGAPLLLGEAMRDVTKEDVEEAALAHMLGVIDAFAVDRVLDGQIRSDDTLSELLEALRRERDAALARVDAASAEAGRVADAVAHAAIAEERALLRDEVAVSMATYVRTSLGKQAPGFPASLALAARAGFGPARRAALRAAFNGVWMGLQAYDDAVDWEDDHAAGGAWAAALAKGLGASLEGPREVDVRAVLASGVLATMVAYAKRCFRVARRLFAVLGAHALGAWCKGREDAMASALANERSAPGYVVRAHKLAGWAGEVLR